MKLNKYSKKRIIITVIICLFSTFAIIFGITHIKLNSSLYNLLPYDQTMIRSLELSQKSSVSKNVLIYIDKTDQAKFEATLEFINSECSKLPIKMTNNIPTANDVTEIMNYFQTNSLLLYPYDALPNPFTAEAVSKGLADKMLYLENMPFFTGSSEFFADPMMAGLNALNFANSMTSTQYFPEYDGVVSPDGTAYLKILSVDFGTEDYESTAHLAKLDKLVSQYSKSNKINVFIYSAHLYFWESMKRITAEISVIFVLSIALTLLIFFVFYRNVLILLYVFMPIIASFGLTFLTIAIFKGEFGAIALAFGSTTAGITIDYSIHYISKINMYDSLVQLRKKIGLSMVMGLATTILSLSFLFFSGIVSLQEIALFGVLAICYSFVFSFFVMQPLLAPSTISIDTRMLHFPKPTNRMLIIWSVLVAICLVGTFLTHFEDNVMMMDARHRNLEKRIATIQKHFSESTDSTFIVFTGDTTDDALYNNYLGFEALSRHNIQINTPSLFVPPQKILLFRRDFVKNHFKMNIFQECLSKSDFETDSFDGYLENVANIYKTELTPMPDFLARHIFSSMFHYNGKVCIMVHIATREQLKIVDKILTDWQVSHIAVSPTLDSGAGLVRFEKNAMKLLFLSLIIVCFILIIYFRNFLLGVLASSPMFIALISVFGVAALTGRGFNIMHFAAGIVVVGISVDYGIYIVDAYRKRHSDEEVNATVCSMFISGLTTLAGFGVLIFSSNRSIFSLGSAMFIGVTMAFLTAYCLVAYCCRLIFKNVADSQKVKSDS